MILECFVVNAYLSQLHVHVTVGTTCTCTCTKVNDIHNYKKESLQYLYNYYHSSHPHTRHVLHTFPTLCCMSVKIYKHDQITIVNDYCLY